MWTNFDWFQPVELRLVNYNNVEELNLSHCHLKHPAEGQWLNGTMKG